RVLRLELLLHRVGPADRIALVELEVAVHHLHLVGVLELLQGVLEALSAEAAERADDVGPDLDLHGSQATSTTRPTTPPVIVEKRSGNGNRPWASCVGSHTTVQEGRHEPR